MNIAGINSRNADLSKSFPTSLRKDALAALSAFPESPYGWQSFVLSVAGEEVLIPQRIYHNPTEVKRDSLTPTQREIADCLLTRHSDGVVRQRSLSRIILSKNSWIPPFVFQLAGEYVIEILIDISKALTDLDPELYTSFLRANPEFFATTEQKAISYWNCYYRRQCNWEDYPGNKIIAFFKSLARQDQMRP